MTARSHARRSAGVTLWAQEFYPTTPVTPGVWPSKRSVKTPARSLHTPQTTPVPFHRPGEMSQTSAVCPGMVRTAPASRRKHEFTQTGVRLRRQGQPLSSYPTRLVKQTGNASRLPPNLRPARQWQRRATASSRGCISVGGHGTDPGMVVYVPELFVPLRVASSGSGSEKSEMACG